MARVVSNLKYGDDDIDGVLFGTKWASPLTYGFPDFVPDPTSDLGPYNHSFAGLVQVSFEQMQAIRQILEGSTPYVGGPVFTYGSFESVAQINLSEAADFQGYSDLAFFQANTEDGFNIPTARVVDFPVVGNPTQNSSGDVVFGDDYNYRNPMPGSYEWITHIHEIGHAMGLKHGHDGSHGLFRTLPFDRDSMEFSVMTYRSYVGGPTGGGYTNEPFGYAQTLMMSDIAALQYLYGANYNTNSGNTTYTWSTTTGQMFLNGAGQGAPGDNRVFLTIWDGNGIDTYDMSNYAGGVSIDLAPGSWSVTAANQLALLDVGNGIFARANVYNAYLHNGDPRSLIENAVGGAGNDAITGNKKKNMLFGNDGADFLFGKRGKDFLNGDGGNDTMKGGQGKDKFIFDDSPVGVHDLILDFKKIDVIKVSASVFPNLALGKISPDMFIRGAAAGDFQDRFIYDRTSGFFSFDQDGIGAAPQVLVAVLTNHAKLHFNDIVVMI